MFFNSSTLNGYISESFALRRFGEVSIDPKFYLALESGCNSIPLKWDLFRWRVHICIYTQRWPSSRIPSIRNEITCRKILYRSFSFPVLFLHWVAEIDCKVIVCCTSGYREAVTTRVEIIILQSCLLYFLHRKKRKNILSAQNRCFAHLATKIMPVIILIKYLLHRHHFHFRQPIHQLKK